MRTLALVVFLFVGCAKDNPKVIVSSAADDSPIERIEADSLLAHYRVNIINADAKFTGKFVQIEKLKLTISKDADGRYYVAHYCFAGYGPDIRCYIRQGEEKNFSDQYLKERVYIIGKPTSYVDDPTTYKGKRLDMEDCRIGHKPIPE